MERMLIQHWVKGFKLTIKKKSAAKTPAVVKTLEMVREPFGVVAIPSCDPALNTEGRPGKTAAAAAAAAAKQAGFCTGSYVIGPGGADRPTPSALART